MISILVDNSFGYATIFIDGENKTDEVVKQRNENPANSFLNEDMYMAVRSNNGAPQGYNNITIDEYLWINKSLSADEISYLYNGGSGWDFSPQPDSTPPTVTITSPTDLWVDFPAVGNLLVSSHHDRPGIIGRVGTALGQSDINISFMHVGRRGPRTEAIMVLCTDEIVPPDMIAQLSSLTHISWLKAVTL